MCRQEARQSARASSGEAKYTGIFDGKCVQCKGQWKLVHLGTFQCGKAEQWKSILHPLLHTVPAKKIRYPTREAILLVIFSISWLGQCPGTCKKKTASLIAATLADAWQELGASLAINWRGGGSGNLVGKNLAKAWNPSEPSGTRRSGGTRRNPAEPGGTRRNPAEPGGTRRNPAEPGGTRRNPAEPGRGTRQNPAEPGRNLAEPGGKKVSWRGGWLRV